MKAFPKLLPAAVLLSLSLGFSGLVSAAETAPPPPPPPPLPHDMVQQLRLNAEQATRLDEALRRGQQRHDEAREQTLKELSALLSPTQQAQLERLMPPGPPPHPHQQPHTPPTPPAPPAAINCAPR